MPRSIRYFFITGLSVIILVFITAGIFNGIVYVNDYIRSVFIRTFNLYEPAPAGSTVIKGENFKKYKKAYLNPPEGIFHFANMLFFRPEKNTGLSELALSAIELTDYYKLYAMKQDILSANRINQKIINSGEVVLIDRSLPPYITDVRGTRSGSIKFTRGLYYSGDNAGSETFIKKLPALREAGINTIVFDIKDVTGIVHIKSGVKEVRQYNLSRNGAIDNLHMLIRKCRENGMYVIARIAVFHDQLLWSAVPPVRIKSKSTGKEWNPGSHEIWCDPTSRKVQDYNIALAVEAAESGVDEVQFDYIRFPTLGDQPDAAFAFDDGKMERYEVISRFLKRAHEEVRSAGAFLSIDIFGVVAWGKEVDINATGQRIALLAEHCDVISPMLYPSHFSDNFDGFKNPGDHPYHFMLAGCRKVIELSGGKVIVRPWLQAFRWRVSNYNPDYIMEQVKGSDDSGAHGYLFWNASNKYDEVLQYMGR